MTIYNKIESYVINISARPNKFDWFIYNLFYRIWNPIFQERPELARYFANYMLEWSAKNATPNNK